VTSFQEADRIFEESQFTKVVFQNQEYDRSKAFDQQPIPGEINYENLRLINVPSMFKWKQSKSIKVVLISLCEFKL